MQNIPDRTTDCYFILFFRYEQFLQRIEGNNEFGSEHRQESGTEREQEHFNDAMINLLELFPHCDASMLKEILIQNNGDTEKVQRLLLGD